MNNKTFLTIHGVIYLVFSLVLFFLPKVIWPVYGVQINDEYANFLSQHTSIFLGGIAAISLYLRDIKDVEAVAKLFKALLTTNLLGVAITLYAGVNGIFTGFGWSDPIFFAVLAILSYLQLNKSSV